MIEFRHLLRSASWSVLLLLTIVIPCASARAEFDTVTRNLNKQPDSRLVSPDRPLIDPSSNKHMHKPSDEFNLPRPDLRPTEIGPPLSDLPAPPRPINLQPKFAN